jgi:hypothetical protein
MIERETNLYICCEIYRQKKESPRHQDIKAFVVWLGRRRCQRDGGY